MILHQCSSRHNKFCMLVILYLSVAGCAAHRKVDSLRRETVAAQLALAKDKEIDFRDLSVPAVSRDTIVVSDGQGNEMILMKAIKDDETGEMVANETIDAAVVTARFRNVAERHGKVAIEFQVIVPQSMQDSRWQLRFNPTMYVLGDSVSLDQVLVTGNDYRKAQLRGYEQYNRFLNSIITDTTRLINMRQLEYFLERNIPQLYSFKTDSSVVSDHVFESVYGVTQKQAVEHYVSRFKLNMNERRKNRLSDVYKRKVKSPIIRDGLRLDTVIHQIGGDFVYQYVQEIETRPKLKNVSIVLDGGIYEQNTKVYSMPRSEALTFYISSLSSFVDNTERYLTKVVERKAAVDTDAYIDFRLGNADVDIDYGNNRTEIRRIRNYLSDIVRNSEYDLDSILVTASSSPEGLYSNNKSLSLRRAKSVSDYFQTFIAHYSDSLVRDDGVFITMDESYAGSEPAGRISEIPFISRSEPENWKMLDILVERDDSLTASQKQVYLEDKLISDPDEREADLRKHDFYEYFREYLYPRLRTVNFDIRMHRRGMVKDTVHTTVIDSTYMKGVQAIRDRDYALAVNLLKPYDDYNTAVAYCALDYNQSALAILERLDESASVEYMRAIIYSRMGDEQNAVQSYIRSCELEPSYVHRGNLDPEISSLIRKFALNEL